MSRSRQKPWKPKVPYAKMGARSKRLVLRPLLVSDLAEWLAVYGRLKPKQNEFDGDPLPPAKRNRKVFVEMIRRQREAPKKRGTFIFAIFERETGEMLGRVDLFVFDSVHRAANLGYLIFNHRWGEGIAPEASRLALDIAFQQLSLLRVEASCELHNRASARVALKAGMFEEGMRRKYPIPCGLRDLYVFGMNVEDWSRQRHASGPRLKRAEKKRHRRKS